LYRPDIDGLRAVAILGVVAYHVGIPGITGGFTGVDVFFVISGFLITQLLVRQVDASGHLSLAEFYARRMRRILPALGVVIGTTLIAGMFILPPTGDRRQMIESALASLGFVANQFFLVNTAGYFDGPSELKPLLHLWSLSVEEQFYILWPLTLILVTLIAPAAKRRTWFRITIGAITLTSFLLSVMLVKAHQSMAFFIAPARAWELGIGALLSLDSPAFSSRLRSAGPVLSWSGSALIIAAYTLIEPTSSFPGSHALLPVMGAGLIIYGNALATDNLCARLLKTRPMVSIGILSYAWYLWHWPLLSFARSERLMAPNIAIDTVMVALALALAALTLRYVENPIRYGATLRGRSRKSVLQIGIASMLVLAAGAASLLAWDQYGTKSARERLAMRVAADHPNPEIQECLRNKWSAVASFDTCRFGAPNQQLELALWGDSHAMAWAPLLQAMQNNGAPAFVLASLSSCRPLLVPGNAPDARSECAEFNRVTLRQIIALKAQGLSGVILSGRWVILRHPSISRYDYSSEHTGLRDVIRGVRARLRRDSRAAPADALREEFSLTLHALQSAGLRVLILLDPPEVKQPIPDCLYIHYDDPILCGISRAEYEQNTSDVVAAITAAAAPFDNVRVLNPVMRFCDKIQCPPIVDGTPMLFDDDHISTSAARALAPSYLPHLHWVLGQ